MNLEDGPTDLRWKVVLYHLEQAAKTEAAAIRQVIASLYGWWSEYQSIAWDDPQMKRIAEKQMYLSFRKLEDELDRRITEVDRQLYKPT